MLQAGTRLGPYEVTGTLGAGGMGEVYRARDTRLDRDVAIKVLPEAVASDAERLARFNREAKTLAALNHPNIAQVHGLEESDGTRALVMELVEGPTLADRIAQGPIPVDEALPIARQIAEALEAAHEQGIIHRDLKPANIKLRPDGTVKVLDFGLAKALGPDAASATAGSASVSPTITSPAMSQAGVILGTAAYMSPEQARGKTVDRRADIWAFGCVLYEMLTGRRAFDAEDVSLTLAEVMKSDVDLDALPPTATSVVRHTLQLCFRKDPRQRYGDMQSVRVALEAHAVAVALASVDSVPAVPVWHRAAPLAVGALAVAAGLVAIGAWDMRPPAAESRVTRLTLAVPDDQPLLLANANPTLALAPDGTRVVYRSVFQNGTALITRSLDALVPAPLVTLAESFSGYSPFFSPDGTTVGFYGDFGINRVAVTGGPSRTIVTLPTPNLRGATWGDGNVIVYGTSESSGLWRTTAEGGSPEPLTNLDPEGGELNHEWPRFLPGGAALLFAVRQQGQAGDGSQIAALDIASGARRVLVQGGSSPAYASSGHLVYAVGGSLWAVAFDPATLSVSGRPVPIVDDVRTRLSGAADYAVSDDGTLIYVAGDAETAADTRALTWVDTTGREQPVEVPAQPFESVSLSPDGSLVALGTGAPAADVWISDLGRGTLEPLAVGPGYDGSPLWSPDGRRVVYASNRSGRWEVLGQAADGSGEAETLVTFDDPLVSRVVPSGWSPDGAWLLVAVGPGDQSLDVGMVSVSDPTSWRYLLRTAAGERNPAVSPDGRWLAYASNESGAYEVYVERFPDGGGRQQVSVGGGHTPRWSADGTSLTYVRSLGPGNPVAMARLTVSDDGQSGTRLVLGRPTDLFPYAYFSQPGGQWWFDMTPDGERFLMIAGPTAMVDPSRVQIVVVQNWFTELERLVPVQ